MLLAGARVYYAMRPRWAVLQGCRTAFAEVEDSSRLVVGPVGLDVPAVSVRIVWSAAGLCDLCCSDLLRPYDCRAVRTAKDTPRCRASVPGDRLSGASCGLYRDGNMDKCRIMRYKPQYTWPGLIIVLLGVPVI